MTRFYRSVNIFLFGGKHKITTYTVFNGLVFNLISCCKYMNKHKILYLSKRETEYQIGTSCSSSSSF